ncbi:MAG: hypothetical protein ACKOB3_02440 [Holophagaceae bacterium]
MLPFLISSILSAQDPQAKPLTSTIQELWDKKDVWLLKRVHPIGSIVGSKLITVGTVSVAEDNTNIEGISLVLDEGNQYIFSLDEANKFTKQLGLLSTKVTYPMSSEETYSFATENGIRIVYSPKGTTLFISLNNITLTQRQFVDLIKLLEKALGTRKSS